MKGKRWVQKPLILTGIFFLFTIFGALIVNCQNGTTRETAGITPKGLVSMKMTDFPLNDKNIKAAIVEIRRIEINTPTGWKTVIDYGDQGKPLDLLTLTNGRTADLGFFQLELGTYDQIRLYLNDNNHIVTQDASGFNHEPLKVPSGVQTGIKLVREFSVTESGTTEILVDFNAEKSISFNKGQGYMLKPTIKVLGVTTTPGVSKVIRAAEGGEISILNDVSISIPPGSLSEDTVVSILPQETANYTDSPNTFMDLKSYQFLPEGIQMSKDATVTMHYDPAAIDTINQLAGQNMLTEDILDIAFFDPLQNRYVSSGRILDKKNNTVTTQTQHFSEWCLVLAVVLLPRLVDAISWETTANNLLQDRDAYNTTAQSAYDGNFIGLRDLYQDNALTILKPNVQTLKDNYEGKNEKSSDPYSKYYVGHPINPKLFILSLHTEVLGYASVPGIAKFYEDVVFGAYVFFHSAQRHDLCDGRGYGTYLKDYAICNDDFNKDNLNRCDKIKTSKTMAYLYAKCVRVAKIFGDVLDFDYALRIGDPNRSIKGMGCDDYDGVFGPVPVDRYTNCSKSGLNVDKILSDNGITGGRPDSIAAVNITKHCPFFELPELHISWTRPAGWSNLSNPDYRTVEISKGEVSEIQFVTFMKAVYALLFPWAVPPVYKTGTLATVRDTVSNSYVDKFDIGAYAKYQYSLLPVDHYFRNGKHIPIYAPAVTDARYCNSELINLCWFPQSACPVQ